MTILNKKFFAIGLFLLQFGAITTANAAYSPISFMPTNPLYYFQLDTTKDHPFKSELNDLITKLSDNPASTIPQQLITAAIDNTVIGFSETENQIDQSSIYMMAFALDETTFNQIISAAPSSELTTENLPMGRKIYLTSGDFYFTYKYGNVVASNQRGLISDVLMTDNSISLAKNPDFQNLLSKINASGFVLGFIDNQKTLVEQSALETDIPFSTAQITGFSAAQDANGLAGQMYLKFPADSLYKPENFTFTPDYYQKISAKNLLYFQEYNNISGQFTLVDQSLENSELPSDLASISEGIATDLGVDVTTDLKPLFTGKSALAIHSDLDNQYYPAFSLLSNVRGQESQAKLVLDKIQKSIITTVNQSLQDSYDSQISLRDYYTEYYPDETNPYANLPSLETLQKQVIQTQTISFNGSNFTQITLDPTEIKGGFIKPEDHSKYLLNLTFGVTNDGNLVFTTFKNPANLFNTTGLNADPNFHNSFAGQRITGLSYLNIVNLRSYVNLILTNFEAPTEISSQIDAFLTPFHSLTAVTTASTGTLLISVQIDADLAQLGQLTELFKPLLNEFNTVRENTDFAMPELYLNFPDVKSSDWFYDYVNSIHLRGLMNGYSDGNFRPNQPITRAEFIKTLVTALDYNYYQWKTTTENFNFKDVQADDWSYSYIQQALNEGFITGYSDQTFRPNQPINRAEAVQILFKASATLKTSTVFNLSDLPFSDVKPTDWFFTAVNAAHHYGIINGKTTWAFQPSDLLTRAETAKMIEKFLSL